MYLRTALLIIALAASTAANAQPKASTTPDLIALFKAAKPNDVASRILAACKARNFETELKGLRVTCASTRLQAPKTGEFIAAPGRDEHATRIDVFVFTLEAKGHDTKVSEKSYHERELPIPAPPLSDAERAEFKAIAPRVSKFVVDLGGVLQPAPK